MHGDLGWMSCLSKQRLEVIRIYYKLYNIEQHRILHKIKVWSKRKQRSWDFKVYKLLSDISLEPLLDAILSKKLFMIEVRRKIRICDEQVWFTKIWNDNSNVNGNKLRLYRNFKKHLVPEHYVLNYMPRHLRSYICKLRCGTLPLVIETGRFNKPPIPLNEKTCPFCYNTVEDEVHFLIDCDIYSDLRLSLFSRATSIETIFCLKSNLDKFIFQINCNELRLELGGLLYNMIRRRRALLSNV